MAGEESSVPVVAVTAAVGAVVLLLVFLCSVSKKTQDDKEEPGKKKSSLYKYRPILFPVSPPLKKNKNVSVLFFLFVDLKFQFLLKILSRFILQICFNFFF